MKRIHALFVSASLPPQWDSQTIRSLYLLSSASEFPIRFTFISPESEKVPTESLAELIPSDTTFETTESAAYFRRSKKVESLLGKRAAWLFKNVYYRIATPDSLAGWDRIALQKMEHVHKNDTVDIVLSASGSPTAHMAASTFSKQHQLPWIADYGDPWSILDRDHRPIAALRSDVLESDTLENCSQLIFTTDETLIAYQKWLGDSLPLAKVIPYGFRSEEVETIGSSSSDDVLTISHIGVAYKGNRNLMPLINALKSHDSEFRLEIVGNHSPSFEQEARVLTDTVFKDRVSYEQASQLMKGSDILVVVGNKAPLQVPGKTYVCLGTQKVILYIGQREPASDPTYKILESLPGVVVCRNELNSISFALKQIKQNWSELRTQAISRVNLAEVRAYESKILSHQFLTTVMEVAAK